VASSRKSTPLETALGYRFKDRRLLDRALTHASARSNGRTAKTIETDNERLEFLGDRVLGLVVAELLLEMMPSASEGELARRFNVLVRGETCAHVARLWGLGPNLILSDSEAVSGGRDKDNILADACEAVLAAVFLEAGFAKVRDLVRAAWAPLVPALPADAADAKSTLQEWAQAQGLPVPSYAEVGREGPDHAPVFTAQVRIDAKRVATGTGTSKRAAEQSAAGELLTKAGVWSRSS
jgi:ribonuclease-3